MQGRWLDCQCADRVVWAAIGSRLVDRQELDESESDLCDPINKLAQRREVADSQVVSPAQRKQWCEDSSNPLLRRQIHSLATDEHG